MVVNLHQGTKPKPKSVKIFELENQAGRTDLGDETCFSTASALAPGGGGTSRVPLSSRQSTAPILLASLMIRNLLRYTWFCADAVL